MISYRYSNESRTATDTFSRFASDRGRPSRTIGAWWTTPSHGVCRAAKNETLRGSHPPRDVSATFRVEPSCCSINQPRTVRRRIDTKQRMKERVHNCSRKCSNACENISQHREFRGILSNFVDTNINRIWSIVITVILIIYELCDSLPIDINKILLIVTTVILIIFINCVTAIIY